MLNAQENSKDAGDNISKQVQSLRAPSKKTKSKPSAGLLGTAQLNDRNKSDPMSAGIVPAQNIQMALLQRQSAGMIEHMFSTSGCSRFNKIFTER